MFLSMSKKLTLIDCLELGCLVLESYNCNIKIKVFIVYTNIV